MFTLGIPLSGITKLPLDKVTTITRSEGMQNVPKIQDETLPQQTHGTVVITPIDFLPTDRTGRLNVCFLIDHTSRKSGQWCIQPSKMHSKNVLRVCTPATTTGYECHAIHDLATRFQQNDHGRPHCPVGRVLVKYVANSMRT